MVTKNNSNFDFQIIMVIAAFVIQNGQENDFGEMLNK